MRHVVHRFPSRQVANLVLATLRTVVIGADCSVSLEDDLSESDIKRGVGKWAIIFELQDNYVNDYLTGMKMSNAVNYALTLALADELHKVNPSNCLLTTWHLKQENRPNTRKYDFTPHYKL
jgi:hypothetical protein